MKSFVAYSPVRIPDATSIARPCARFREPRVPALLGILVLLVFGSSVAFAAGNSTKSRVQPKEAPPKVVMSSFGNEEAVPDPNDEIAASREWRDATGEHTCKAQLQSVQAGKVALKKEDGTLSNFSLTKLHKDDQELIRDFLTRYARTQIEKAIQAYRKADPGGTDADAEKVRKAEEEPLQKKVNGRVLQLVFRIKNVDIPQGGFSTLVLAAPNKGGDGWEYRTSAKMKLSKEDILKTGPASVLVVEGKARVLQVGPSTKGQATGHNFGNEDRAVMTYDGVVLTLENLKMTVQHRTKPEKAAKNDATSGNAGRAGTIESTGNATATVPETQDLPDRERTVPDPSDALAKSRAWRDASGDHSITAELRSVEGSIVALKTANGTVAKIALTKLHKEDQELIRDLVLLSSKRKIVSAVTTYFNADFGDTDARVAQNEKAKAEKLVKAINGMELRLAFPIKSIAPSGQEKGIYTLKLGAPDFPGAGRDSSGQSRQQDPTTDRSRRRVGDFWDYKKEILQKLSKEESSKVGLGSILIVHGRVRLDFGGHEATADPGQTSGRGPSPSRTPRVVRNQTPVRDQSPGRSGEAESLLNWEGSLDLPSGGHVNQKVSLFLDNPRMTIHNE